MSTRIGIEAAKVLNFRGRRGGEYQILNMERHAGMSTEA